MAECIVHVKAHCRMGCTIRVVAHTRRCPTSGSIKKGSKSQAEKKELMEIVSNAYSEMHKYRDDPEKYRKYSDIYWDASEKLYKKYGVS